MPLHFKDPELERLVRRLADQRHQSLTDAVKMAVRAALKEPPTLSPEVGQAVDKILDALRPLQEKMSKELRRVEQPNFPLEVWPDHRHSA